MSHHKETRPEPTLEERLARVEMLLGLRPHGVLLLPGDPAPVTDQRVIPGPGNTRITVGVGG
jgi:hypothetical protein